MDLQRNLDILRASAVALVLLDHVLETVGAKRGISFQNYPQCAGRLGVMLFFIHTSLVLNLSMARLGTGGWTLIRTFLVRRSFRLYPLSIACVLLAFAIKVPPMPYQQQVPHYTWGDFLSNLALTTNLTGTVPVLGPLWSLPVEAQMYMALPLIFLLLGPTASPRIALGAWLAACLFAWYYPTATAVNVTDLAPCFLAGVVAYTLSSRFPTRLPSLLWPAFLLTMLAGFAIGQQLMPEGFYNLPFEWIFCLAVGIAIPMFRDSTATAVNYVSHRVARYSYGIYLFHCIGLWIGCTVLSSWWEPLQWTTAAAITALLSITGYHYLEKPAIDLGARLTGSCWARSSSATCVRPESYQSRGLP